MQALIVPEDSIWAA